MSAKMFYDEPSDYLGFLPESMQGVLEMQKIADAVNCEVDDLLAVIKKEVKNKFAATADEDGIARWEEILAVDSPLDASLESRRAAVLAKKKGKPPINEETMRNIVETYLELPIQMWIANYIVSIRYRGIPASDNMNPLYATLYDTIPANLVLDIDFLYLTWDELDSLHLTWDELDAIAHPFDNFERGLWIGTGQTV